jgi:hypothetical protein
MTPINNAHQRLLDAIRGITPLEEVVTASRAEQERRAKDLDEQRPRIPSDAHQLLIEALGVGERRPEPKAHERMLRAIRGR